MPSEPPPSASPWRLIASCLGLSWAFHLSVWRNIYTFYGPEAAYYLDGNPSWKPGAAVFVSALAFAAAVAALRGGARRSGNRVFLRAGEIVFLGLGAIALWKFSLYTLAQVAPSPRYGIALYFAFCFATVALALSYSHRPDRTFRAAESAAVAFLPLVAISSLQLGVWLWPASDALASEQAPTEASAVQPAGGQRVVWVLFDELDSEIAFSPQPPVPLPNFESLRRQAFSNLAVEPSSMATLTAIPELTMGKRLISAEPAGAQTLAIEQDGGESTWAEQDNVFDWASRRGRRVAIAGWYHPYCRLFGETLSACTFASGGAGATAMRSGLVSSRMPFSEAIALQAGNEWRLAAAMVFLQADTPINIANLAEIHYGRLAQLEAFQRLRGAALEYAADPALDFVFVHLPVPHPVGIFDRRTGDYSVDETVNYVDNLALADKTLGEIRAAIEEAGLAARTALVVNSDHAVRAGWSTSLFWTDEMDRLVELRGSQRTPLFVHTPGAQPAAYEEPLSALVVSNLLRLLLEGGSPQPSHWAAWMAALPPAPSSASSD